LGFKLSTVKYNTVNIIDIFNIERIFFKHFLYYV
jgi:hypothetical protein